MPNHPLTKEQHLLVCLAEERAEVIQEINKALRFGLDHRWPEEESPSLRERIVKELTDMVTIEGILEEEGVLPSLNYDDIDAKMLKVVKYMEVARLLGTLLPEENNEKEPSDG